MNGWVTWAFHLCARAFMLYFAPIGAEHHSRSCSLTFIEIISPARSGVWWRCLPSGSRLPGHHGFRSPLCAGQLADDRLAS
jgi:hypothetical protein